jgi:DNA-binding response OmpR family regulator
VTITVPIRALVLMDRPLLARTVALALDHGHFSCRIAENVEAAAALIAEWPPDLAVIDMDLGDGAVLRRLRIERTVGRTAVPVLGLTRRGDLKTKLAAFAEGVDDVMTVPFSPEELLARAVVITGRTFGIEPPLRPTVRLGELVIDILNREVRAGDSVIHLTGLEQSLLYLLAANAGRVIGREEILDALWGTDFVSESNIVDRHIRGLRAKLQNDWRRPRFIATVPGKGYRFLPTSTDDAMQA